MKKTHNGVLPSSAVRVAIGLIECIADSKAKPSDAILVPTAVNYLVKSSKVIYNDTPWMIDQLTAEQYHIIHPKIPNATAAALGLRPSSEQAQMGALEVIQNDWGESFGQQEEITTRIASILVSNNQERPLSLLHRVHIKMEVQFCSS